MGCVDDNTPPTPTTTSDHNKFFFKAPTLRLKALNKHNITHSVHRDGKCYQQCNKHNITHSVHRDG